MRKLAGTKWVERMFVSWSTEEFEYCCIIVLLKRIFFFSTLKPTSLKLKQFRWRYRQKHFRDKLWS